MIPIIIGVLDTVTKGLIQELEDLEIGGRVEIIQTTALLRSTRILRKVPESCGDLLSPGLQWKTINNHGVKNSQKRNNNENLLAHNYAVSGMILHLKSDARLLVYGRYCISLRCCFIIFFLTKLFYDLNLNFFKWRSYFVLDVLRFRMFSWRKL